MTAAAQRLAVAAAIACVLLPAPSFAAEQKRLAWSTYLRSGPGDTYRVLDELEHDAAVAVVGCSTRWCRVSADGLEGFIDRDALDLPRSPTPGLAPATACLVVGQTDARKPKPTRFCAPSIASKAPPAA